MEQGKKKIPSYKLKALIGIIVSIIIAFAGVYYKHVSILGFLTPIGLFLGMFFAGYHMRGIVKDGIKWVACLLLLLGLAALLSYIKN